jgi:hypothetical protein
MNLISDLERVFWETSHFLDGSQKNMLISLMVVPLMDSKIYFSEAPRPEGRGFPVR